jgi:hypothetical protein
VQPHLHVGDDVDAPAVGLPQGVHVDGVPAEQRGGELPDHVGARLQDGVAQLPAVEGARPVAQRGELVAGHRLPVLVDQRTAGEGERGTRGVLDAPDQVPDTVVGQHVVVQQVLHELPAGLGQEPRQVLVRADVRLVADDPDAVVRGRGGRDELRCPVGGAVVADEHLDGAVALAHRGPQRRPQVPLPVVGGHQDAHQRLGHPA